MNIIIRLAFLEPLPFVRRDVSRIVAKVLSIGFVVRRWPQCSVANSKPRRLRQPSLLEVKEQLDPALLALTDAVCPGVDALLLGEVATIPVVVLLAPLLLEPDDDVRAESLGVRADQRLESLRGVSRRASFEVEPWDQLLHRATFPEIGRQDRRGEGDPVVHILGLVTYPRLFDIERTGSGHDGAGRKVAVADHPPSATLIELVIRRANQPLIGAQNRPPRGGYWVEESSYSVLDARCCDQFVTV